MPARSNHGPQVNDIIGRLKAMGEKVNIDAMARYGIPSDHAVGVAVGELKSFAKKLGHDHELALGLWASGLYEARMLAAFVGEPAKLTAKQMTDWVADFDSWAICDHCCFHLFDRSAHAWKKIPSFAKSKKEFVKRTAFALLWSLSVHDKKATDQDFIACLPLLEAAAEDERIYVKKSVDMALRAIGKRNAALNDAASILAARLAESADPTASWIGKHARRELTSDSVQARLA